MWLSNDLESTQEALFDSVPQSIGALIFMYSVVIQHCSAIPRSTIKIPMPWSSKV